MRRFLPTAIKAWRFLWIKGKLQDIILYFSLSLRLTHRHMNLIKAVIFDFDGTLANTIPLCIEAFRKAVEPIVQRPLSDEEIMSTFGPDEEGSIRKLAPQHYEEATADFYEALQSPASHVRLSF